MCGIVGYLGNKEAVPILIDGLKHLEYRGYDSAGLALYHQEQIQVVRVKGKLKNLEEQMVSTPLSGQVGLGHTRWATHGKPSERNAHPHCGCNGAFAVVHNGIVENYARLKEELMAQGHCFHSDTDTEVLAHLIEKYFRGNLEEAVREALMEVEGSYALAVISKADPEKIIVARFRNPIIIGLGEGEYFVASDIPAILNYTREQITLGDGEMGIISREKVAVRSLTNGYKVSPKPTRILWDPVQAEKLGYCHFMLKEIHEQPRAIADTLAGRVLWKEGTVKVEDCNLSSVQLKGIGRVSIIACGTSYHAGLVGRSFIEQWSQIPVEVEIASEFRSRSPLMDPTVLTVAISQSGETADTLAAVREAKAKGSLVVAITNVVDSSVARESHGTIYTHAGPEIGVASTKAFTCQLTALYLLALYLAQLRGTLTKKQCISPLGQLMHLPQLVEEMLKKEPEVVALARRLKDKNNFLFLGRGTNYPIALEGALKLKEISYIHAEGYPAGEMKHGPIALIDENMPVVFLAPQDETYPKIMGNMEEVKARDGIVVALATEGDEDVSKRADYVIHLPRTSATLTGVLLTIPLQLLAYHIGVLRGCDVDQPRNLAKSVTVE